VLVNGEPNEDGTESPFLFFLEEWSQNNSCQGKATKKMVPSSA